MKRRYNIYCLTSLFLLVLLCGCASWHSPNQEYARINFSDGISINEAIVIGKEELSACEYRHEYRSQRGNVMTNRLARAHPDYWFVSFESKRLDRHFWSYLVVVNKQTGQVVFSDPHVPLDMINYDWIFDRAQQ